MKKSLLSTIIISVLSFSLNAETYLVTLSDKHYKGFVVERPVDNSPDAGNPVSNNASCKEILDSGSSTGNGVYTINNGSKDYDVYCDMTTAGGGWTLAVAQFESNPEGWNEGIQADYDPTLSSGQSFALNSSELPSHSQISFYSSTTSGSPTAQSDYFNYTYTTGAISKTVITSAVGGLQFHIAREPVGYYHDHDPERTFVSSSHAHWNDTLTVDRVGITGYDFMFSPNAINQNRGYGYAGVARHGSHESFAWVIWVR